MGKIWDLCSVTLKWKLKTNYKIGLILSVSKTQSLGPKYGQHLVNIIIMKRGVTIIEPSAIKFRISDL